MWGRGWGNGVYLSGTEEFAGLWGSIILRCELKEGCRLLWHEEYDRNVIAYLKREFGAGILRPDFWRALPRNKQLTRQEIVAVWNYLMKKHYLGRRAYEKGLMHQLQRQYSRIYEQLKRHRFDGVGCREADWPEMLIFNPSMVKPVSVHRYLGAKVGLSEALSEEQIDMVHREAELERRSEMVGEALKVLTEQEQAEEWARAFGEYQWHERV